MEGKLDKVVELASDTAARMKDVAAIVLGDAAHPPITDRVGTVETDVATLKFGHAIWAKLGWVGLGGVATWAATHWAAF
jgi:hypothetical protein